VALGHAKRLDTGDVLIVTRLDRLAGSTRDLLNTGRKA
jgi:DNA invertase Pin-like site-specific DNA recombinase